jgi:hypothetical protein
MLWWTDGDKKRRYYPDFYLPEYDIYVDTKNPYLMKCDARKIDCVSKENGVKIICGDLDKVKEILTESFSVI